MDADALKVNRGDDIFPAWQRLVKWVESLKIIPLPGIRRYLTPQGTRIVLEDSSTNWPHPWYVDAAGMEARIGEGTVNALMPRIKGVRLDGLTDKMEYEEVPPLKLEGIETGKTWVALRVLTTEGRIDPENKEALTIVETKTLNPRIYEGGAPDLEGVGLWPLAVLYWREGKLFKTFQIAHHNLIHRFERSNDERPDRHLLWAT